VLPLENLLCKYFRSQNWMKMHVHLRAGRYLMPPLNSPPQVLGMLPFELRSKILRQLYAGIIARVPLLRTMAHDDVFLTDVCVRLQHYTCTRDSFVYQRGGLAVARWDDLKLCDVLEAWQSLFEPALHF
jgi:hypothetical protein